MFKEELDKLTLDYNGRIKYHFEGERFIPFLKSLDVFDRYKIYTYYLVKILALNTQIKGIYKHKPIDFFDWSYEQIANFYWKFEDEINNKLKPQ